MIDWLRSHCLSFPHATESLQWEALVFKVAGKIFAIAALEPERYILSIKCAEEKFAEMLEIPGIAPAPYLGRAKWIALESEDAMPQRQLRALIRESYDLVVANLPAKTRETLLKPGATAAPAPPKKRRK
jgi:predicted DNA-binding protein (MmcQ/YjbR family)